MSGIKINDITHIAYTAEPGLPGSLHVGKVFAKTLAYSLDVPLVPVNHMLGHVFSYAIGDAQQIKFPFICLVASGGHTSLYKFTSAIDYEILNETADDAIGEALDKIGRMLNLEYPGGVSIDKQYNPSRTNYKLIDHRAPNEPFSFSGLKTHILNEINICKMKNKQIDVELLASSTLK
jgi:N6-L-threonylcarbamoyladenine synthase